MAVYWYAWLGLVTTALGASIAPEKLDFSRSKCGQVWVTVYSPELVLESGERVIDALELNWDFSQCFDLPKQIGLFAGEPTAWSEALFIHSIENAEGFTTTTVPIGDTYLPGGWDNRTEVGSRGPQCLWPWVVAGDDTEVRAYDCLKIQPTWMEDNGDAINKLHLGELVLPGTHNAGSWHFNTEINNMARDAFILCQDRSIWDQLVYGIRYLDFRIGYYAIYSNEDDRFWLNHNLIRVRPLVPLLREIKSFLDNTKEVVFLDMHHFPIGFYDPDGVRIQDAHTGLMELVQRELGTHIAPARDYLVQGNQLGPTLSRFIETDKRLVFSYIDNNVVNENNWLWPPLPHLWANTNDPEELLNYLDRAIAMSPNPNSRSPLYSAMAQTTPTVLDILFLRGSLRQNADAVNRNITRRLMNEWQDEANIVSTDFFLGDNVIDVSIEASLRKSRLKNT